MTTLDKNSVCNVIFLPSKPRCNYSEGNPSDKSATGHGQTENLGKQSSMEQFVVSQIAIAKLLNLLTTWWLKRRQKISKLMK